MRKIFMSCFILGIFFYLLTGKVFGQEPDWQGQTVPKKAESETVAPQNEERILPKKVELDTNADGKVDRVENYNNEGIITGIESDTNGDGSIDEWLYYEGGKLTKAAKDSNGDGKQDTWVTY